MPVPGRTIVATILPPGGILVSPEVGVANDASGRGRMAARHSSLVAGQRPDGSDERLGGVGGQERQLVALLQALIFRDG
jgi:hypothetical protein